MEIIVLDKLIEALRDAPAEDVAKALMALEEARPGFGWEVGVALHELGASKEFPGPPWYWEQTVVIEHVVVLEGFDADRRLEVLKGIRLLTGCSVADARLLLGSIMVGPALDPVPPYEQPEVAEERAKRWREFGVRASVERRGPQPPETHRKTLSGLGVPFRGFA